jgi:hypothetical protein
LSWIYPSKKSENDGSNSSIATLFDHTYWSVFIKMRQTIFWYKLSCTWRMNWMYLSVVK